MRRKLDWDLIRREYIEGVRDPAEQLILPSARELAERHGARPNTIRKRAAAEDWTERRREYSRQAETARQEARIRATAEEAAELDVKALRTARDGLTLVARKVLRIADADRRYEEELLSREEAADDPIHIPSTDRQPFSDPVDALAMLRLVRAAERCLELAHEAAGYVRREQENDEKPKVLTYIVVPPAGRLVEPGEEEEDVIRNGTVTH
jgi:hypothetical protein